MMLVTTIKSPRMSQHRQGEEGTAHVHVTFCVTPRSPEKTRRIRRGFGKCLRERSKTSCSHFLDSCAFG